MRPTGSRLIDDRPFTVSIALQNIVQAYKLLLGAGGSLASVTERCCPILEDKSLSADCSYQVISTLVSLHTISASLC